MMTTDTKDLIASLRTGGDEVFSTRKKSMIADALERLAQPVGVEPVAWLAGETPLYSAQQIGRLQAELDEERKAANEYAEQAESFAKERDALQAQVRVWENSAPTDAYVSEFSSLQEQVKTLQRLVRNSTEFLLGVPEFEALAGTENKEPK